MQHTSINYRGSGVSESTVLPNRVFHERMRNVLNRLSDVLNWHYGPYSRFALIANLDNPLEEPRFTKDGIGIIRSVTFDNPVDNYINQVMAFIGGRIENSIGDGTTSAMLFVCQFLLELIEKKAVDRIDYRNLRTLFDAMIELYEEEQKKEAIFLKDIKDPVAHKRAIANISFAQAYTSSHGDVNLAKMVQQVFMSAPEDTWNVMTFARDNFETDKPISVDIDDAQFTFDYCAIHHPYMLNAKGDTVFEAEDVVLVVAPWGFDNTAKEQTEKLLDLVTQIAEKKVEPELADKHWVLVIPKIRDMHYYSAIEDRVQNYADIWKRFGIFEYATDNDTINEYHGFCAVMGVDYRELIASGIPKVKTGVKMYYGNDHKLKLYNIYDDPEGYTGDLHPGLLEDGVLKSYVDLVSTTIDQMKNSLRSLQPRELEQLKKFQQLHRKLVVRKRVTIRIGGGAIDNTANVDVIQDVIHATRNSLMKGCVRGGNMAMYATFARLFTAIRENKIPLDEYTKGYLSSISEAAVTALKRIITNAYQSSHSDNKVDPRTILAACLDDEKFPSYNHLENEFVKMEELINNTNEGAPKLIIQPIGTTVAILQRFAEVGLKLLKTEEMITPGFTHNIDVQDEKYDKMLRDVYKDMEDLRVATDQLQRLVSEYVKKSMENQKRRGIFGWFKRKK